MRIRAVRTIRVVEQDRVIYILKGMWGDLEGIDTRLSFENIKNHGVRFKVKWYYPIVVRMAKTLKEWGDSTEEVEEPSYSMAEAVTTFVSLHEVEI